MKSKKKHIFIILVICMAWSLYACGGNASGEAEKAESELESMLDSEK